MYDLLLVGGGLANSLLAYRLKQLRPEVSFLVLEAHDFLGGNHTWSFHRSDVSDSQWQWLEPLLSMQWAGHDVAFPGRQRRLGGTYASIRSHEFNEKVMRLIGDSVRVSTRVKSLTGTSVELASGETLQARAVIDGRGFSSTAVTENGGGLDPEGRHEGAAWGFQKFLGLEVELSEPHGLTVPFVMDARVEQLGGYRFVYSLPWTARSLVIEDTYYTDGARFDRAELRARVEQYAASQGWKISKVIREEAAALPIPFGGKAPQHAVPTIGVAAGLFNAATGYSLPWAVETADLICAQSELTAAGLTALLNLQARNSWKQQRFFRLLNRMLFKGAKPEQRVRIFESFYGHDEALIARFYAGRLTIADQLKVLARGAPTVPGLTAMRAALG